MTLSDAQLFRLYETEFFTNGSYADYEGDKPILQKNFARFVQRLKPFSAGGRLLDLGCAYGFFLEQAREFWQVEGVDVVADPTRFAREQLKLNVTTGDFLDVPFEPKTYDIVTMWDTIEHVRRPAAYVAKISQILKPGGILALTTGDVGSLMARLQGRQWRLYDPPFHIHYFSRRTVTRLLKAHRFDILQIRSVGFSRSVNTMLHRLFCYQKPPAWHRVYRVADQLGVTRFDLYLDLFDIMFVIARVSS
jgi:2-polyprenyl-3-methyl-5-hydroxy-6-metoxy-1,4-benzoquinol methylase